MREIKPINNHGSIQLKFSFGGKRYSFNPVPGGAFSNSKDLVKAQRIAVKIQRDILAQKFDPSLEKYRLVRKVKKPQIGSLLDLWDLWVDYLDLPEATKANHYRYLRVQITKSNPGLLDTQWFTKSDLAPKTYNNRLSMLRSCGNWGVSKGYIRENPYGLMKARRGCHKEIKPFTTTEITKILSGFAELFPQYYEFVYFLFATGVRTSEAIGLRWENIDFERGEVVIKGSMPKDLTGNGYRRICKGTKTGSIRYLPLTPQMRSLLYPLKKPDMLPDILVFTTPHGNPIDTDNFRDRQWTKVLAAQGIPYRNLYITRHTMASHGIEQGIPLASLAYLLGHRDITMLIKHYAHMINRPNLPNIPLG